MVDTLRSKWVKEYMAVHGCSKQAAYKAYGKMVEAESQPKSTEKPVESTISPGSQPKSKPDLETRLILLEAQVDRLESELRELKARSKNGESAAARQVLTDVPRPPKVPPGGSSKLLPHRTWR